MTLHPITMELRALALGATLYMPVIHHNAARAFAGDPVAGARSIVLCLEDALQEADIPQALLALEEGLRTRLHEGVDNTACMLFVRPRNLDMARAIARMDGVGTLAGFVAPKMTPDNAGAWLRLSEERGVPLMPTLETGDMFQPSTVETMRRLFDSHARQNILAVRVGGNDLMGALGLRRRKGVVSYDSALGWPLQMIAAQMMAGGYAVTAPVWEIVEDVETLKREVAEDVARGFSGKTAIHPSQVAHIHAAFQPGAEEVAQAHAILDSQAKAVFMMGGAMCEPATHTKWAQKTLARAHLYGVQGHTPVGV
jgi:citrate lyase beta subunit